MASLPLTRPSVRPPDASFALPAPPALGKPLLLPPHAPAMRGGPAASFADPPSPSRATLFWQSVAAAESFTPLGQAAADPALDLDSIADALHAIADLRGVAR